MKALVLLGLVTVASAKVFERCELARTLKAAGMDGFHGTKLADWVCLAKWESDYNTKKVKNLKDRNNSSLYGLFQLNSKLWCDDGQTHESKNACRVKCSALLSDNIQASIACAKKVVKGENGLRNWVDWRHHCEGRDIRKYVAGCGV
ncbi:lysozyme C, spleen isozyme-like [Engraulis encrasicolus]|uniref:lysozyme C, spleen isozyme-like n=1 Tax=Engraulis encrasicolus TaxID=184585 RepID=UPI002FD42CEF